MPKRATRNALPVDKPAEWAWEHQREIYRERDMLVALLSRIYPSHVRQHPRSSQSHKLVVCIHTPFGQLAWTITDDYMLELYKTGCETTEAQDSDRATTAEKYARIEAHIRATPARMPREIAK